MRNLDDRALVYSQICAHSLALPAHKLLLFWEAATCRIWYGFIDRACSAGYAHNSYLHSHNEELCPLVDGICVCFFASRSSHIRSLLTRDAFNLSFSCSQMAGARFRWQWERQGGLGAGFNTRGPANGNGHLRWSRRRCCLSPRVCPFFTRMSARNSFDYYRFAGLWCVSSSKRRKSSAAICCTSLTIIFEPSKTQSRRKSSPTTKNWFLEISNKSLSFTTRKSPSSQPARANWLSSSLFLHSVLIEGVKYNADKPNMIAKTFLRLERDFDKHVTYCRDEPLAQEFLTERDEVRNYFKVSMLTLWSKPTSPVRLIWMGSRPWCTPSTRKPLVDFT